MKPNNRNPCKNCENRGCGKHASCEAYLKFYQENRERNEAEYKRAILNDYTKQEIRKTKAGTWSTMSRYRPKGR